MPNVILYPNSGALAQAELAQTALALSKLRLWKVGEITPGPTTTAAELEAAEADYTGYAAGGLEITAFLPPILAPEGGYSIQSPTEQFATGSPTTVGNVIGGWWLEDATGEVWVIAGFDVGVPMEEPGQGLPISARLVYPNGNT